MSLDATFDTLRARRVLVTGGTGFLGNHLVRRLVGVGAAVSVLARPSSTLIRISDVASKVRLILGDIRVGSHVRDAVKLSQPEVIFHLAAYGVDPKKCDAITTIQTNVVGLINLLEASVDIPYSRFLNTGTCFEYGNHGIPISESVAVDPLNVYAASKVMAVHLCRLHGYSHGKPIVTIRPFTFFGPWERIDRLIPSVILSILDGRPIRITSGVQTRDYTYVEDVVDAFLRAAVAEQAVGQTINSGTGEDLSVLEIVERIKDLMKSNARVEIGSVPNRRDEAWRLCADNSKARALLGWSPRFSFEEGLERTVEWFSRHGRAWQGQARPGGGVDGERNDGCGDWSEPLIDCIGDHIGHRFPGR